MSDDVTVPRQYPTTPSPRFAFDERGIDERGIRLRAAKELLKELGEEGHLQVLFTSAGFVDALRLDQAGAERWEAAMERDQPDMAIPRKKLNIRVTDISVGQPKQPITGDYRYEIEMGKFNDKNSIKGVFGSDRMALEAVIAPALKYADAQEIAQMQQVRAPVQALSGHAQADVPDEVTSRPWLNFIAQNRPVDYGERTAKSTGFFANFISSKGRSDSQIS